MTNQSNSLDWFQKLTSPQPMSFFRSNKSSMKPILTYGSCFTLQWSTNNYETTQTKQHNRKVDNETKQWDVLATSHNKGQRWSISQLHFLASHIQALIVQAHYEFQLFTQALQNRKEHSNSTQRFIEQSHWGFKTMRSRRLVFNVKRHQSHRRIYACKKHRYESFTSRSRQRS